jgi:hypothetical protein
MKKEIAMKAFRFATWMTVGFLLLPLVGCDSAHEKAQKKMISYMGDYADILSGIKSNTDFVDAKPKLERLGAQIKDLAKETKALPQPTADEQKKLGQQFEADSKQVSDRLQSEMQRLEKIGVSPLDVMSAMKVSPDEFMQ